MRGQLLLSSAEDARKRCGLVLIGIGIVAMLALFAAPASADYIYRTSFAGFAELESPRRAAVEQSTGNLFVVDSGHDRVVVYKPEGYSGSVVAELGVGTLDDPYGIAIRESGGQTEIYVSDAGNDRIVRFLSDEQATPSFTVDATYGSPMKGTEAGQVADFASPLALAPNGDLWVADRGANEVKRFDPTGAHVADSNFDGSSSPGGAFTGLLDIAANSGGDLYVIDTTGDVSQPEGSGRALRFSAAGSYLARLEPVGVRPAMVAVNPGDDSVVVSAGQDSAYRFSPPTLHLFDAANAPADEFQSLNTNLSTIQGLAFRSATKSLLYVITDIAIREEAPWGEAGIHVFEDATPPVVTVDPPSSVTTTEATINGTVDPEGVATEWMVQYRQSGENWSSTPAETAGAGTDPVNVEATLSGLTPGATYRVRILATSADGETASPERSFTLDSNPPQILEQSARAAFDQAVLRAKLDTGGTATTYRFEYGPTAAYGSQTEVRTTAPGAGVVDVSAELLDLPFGTTYHYRVVIDSPKGGGVGADQTFTTMSPGGPDTCPNAAYRTGAAAGLTDCRAYELVTPPGSQARVRLVGGDSTPNGDVVCFSSEDTLAGSDPNGVKTTDEGYCSWRRSGGWETKWVTGPAPAPEHRIAAMGANVYWISPDAERVVYASDAMALSPGFREYTAPAGDSSLGTHPTAFMWESGQRRWLAPSSPPVGDPPKYIREGLTRDNEGDGGGNPTGRRPVAVSDDLTHGLFESDLKILPEDENEERDVYEWYPGGLRIVSRDGSGKAVGGRLPLQTFSQFIAYPGTISADGSRIFFERKGDLGGLGAPADVYSVYMREGDDLTLVSPRGGAGPDEDVEFVGASADGDIVYLESPQQLTSEVKESGKAIYRYDVSAGEMELAATADGGVKLLRSSRNAATFVYHELTSNQLVVQRDGVDQILGILDFGDINNEFAVASYRGYTRQLLRITPDGGTVVFAGRSGFAGTPAGPTQIYRWTAEDGLERISVASDGALPSADASIGAYPGASFGDPREELFSAHREKAVVGRVVSDDGSRVVFETREALVDHDINGANDVYEWHDGEVSLISSGTGTGSYYHDSTPDGKTIFFTTYQRLIPALDGNNSRDLYAARPGGGFPLPAPPPSCAGESCQPASPPPTARGTGSGSGEGNVAPKPAILRLGKKQLARLASGGTATIKVKVAAPGKVTATLKGRVNGRRATVATASKSASAPGVVALKLKLSKRALGELKQEDKLRLALEVRQQRSDGVVRKEVMLRG